MSPVPFDLRIEGLVGAKHGDEWVAESFRRDAANSPVRQVTEAEEERAQNVSEMSRLMRLLD